MCHYSGLVGSSVLADVLASCRRKQQKTMARRLIFASRTPDADFRNCPIFQSDILQHEREAELIVHLTFAIHQRIFRLCITEDENHACNHHRIQIYSRLNRMWIV